MPFCKMTQYCVESYQSKFFSEESNGNVRKYPRIISEQINRTQNLIKKTSGLKFVEIYVQVSIAD